MLGAYTTFSTFSVETLDLLNDGEWRTAALYVLASVAGALAAAWAGLGMTTRSGPTVMIGLAPPPWS